MLLPAPSIKYNVSYVAVRFLSKFILHGPIRAAYYLDGHTTYVRSRVADSDGVNPDPGPTFDPPDMKTGSDH